MDEKEEKEVAFCLMNIVLQIKKNEIRELEHMIESLGIKKEDID